MTSAYASGTEPYQGDSADLRSAKIFYRAAKALQLARVEINKRCKGLDWAQSHGANADIVLFADDVIKALGDLAGSHDRAILTHGEDEWQAEVSR